MYSFDFIAGLNFGILQEEQIRELTKVMTDANYKSDISSPGLIVFSTTGSQLIINPNQYVFKNQISDSVAFDNITDLVIKTFKGLNMGAAKINITCRISEAMQNAINDAGEILKGYIDFEITEIPGVKTTNIGYRFLNENDGTIGEFKVEPLIQNTKILYFEGIYNCNNIDIQVITKKCQEAFDDFLKKQEYFLKKVDSK